MKNSIDYHLFTRQIGMARTINATMTMKKHLKKYMENVNNGELSELLENNIMSGKYNLSIIGEVLSSGGRSNGDGA